MTGDMEEFARQAREFLDAHAAPKTERGEFRWGEGDDRVAYFSADPPGVEAQKLEAARDWQRTRYENGFGWISGPPQYGGRGLTPVHELVYDSIEAGYDVPATGTLSVIGLGMIGPTILAHGQQAVKDRYLPAMYRGDAIACQLFSEPDAGSTSPACGPGPQRTEIAGSSTARRCGRRWRSTARSGWRYAGPTRARPSTRASPRSSSTCPRPGSRCARCAR